MRVHTVVAVFEGCPFEVVDDPTLLSRACDAAVQAGGFTKLHEHTHRFHPQGVTGTVVLGESHIAYHSWPEEGVLYLDIATCGDPNAIVLAFEAFKAAIPHEGITLRDLGVSTRRGESVAAAPLGLLR